jgi:hypothetical protein
MSDKKADAWNKINILPDTIISEYKSGKSINQIAKDRGLSRVPITRILKESGIKMRNQSQAEKLKWSQMSDIQRIKQVQAAHDSTKGRYVPIVERRKRAISFQACNSRIGIGEEIVQKFFKSENIDFVYQFPIDGYNLDFLVSPVAVEVNIGGKLPHKRITDFKKIKDLSGRMQIIYIHAYSIENITTDKLKNFITIFDIAKSSPPIDGQYWMIWCCRDHCFTFSCNINDVSSIPTFQSLSWFPKNRNRC